MNISFIIPAYNEEKYIAECLKSIIKYGPPDAEIIVVDNNSTDATAQTAMQFPSVILLEEKKGTNSARQCGLSAATGDMVAFIDADCRLSPGWLEMARTEFAKNPRLSALSGPYYFPEIKSKFTQWVTKIYHYFSVIVCRIIGYAIYGGNLVARRSALLQSGGLNTNLVFHGDDADTGKRLKKYGQVKFLNEFFVFSSARRLNEEGIVKIGGKYILNYLWVVFFNKPWHTTNQGIR